MKSKNTTSTISLKIHLNYSKCLKYFCLYPVVIIITIIILLGLYSILFQCYCNCVQLLCGPHRFGMWWDEHRVCHRSDEKYGGQTVQTHHRQVIQRSHEIQSMYPIFWHHIIVYNNGTCVWFSIFVANSTRKGVV